MMVYACMYVCVCVRARVCVSVRCACVCEHQDNVGNFFQFGPSWFPSLFPSQLWVLLPAKLRCVSMQTHSSKLQRRNVHLYRHVRAWVTSESEGKKEGRRMICGASGAQALKMHTRGQLVCVFVECRLFTCRVAVSSRCAHQGGECQQQAGRVHRWRPELKIT